MEQTINTIIVLRNDSTTAWETSEYIMHKGEVGIGYLENGNVIAKLGDGENTWANLPQIEGVFEKDITLTYDFGKYKISNGYVVTPATGKTTSQWLIDALSEIKEPVINQPSITMSASPTISGTKEIGSQITAINWNGNFKDGSYQYGSVENSGSTATGLSAANVSWSISNSIDGQTASTEDGTFTITGGIQLDSENSKTYATITGKYTLDATNARTPLNNVGAATSGKIESKAETALTANVNASSYRKPFWGVLTQEGVLDTGSLTSAQIRALPNSGSATKGFPASLSVPVGSQMVIFAAKAGAYNSLAATDTLAMNATVAFEKIANAVQVEGANGFTAVDYDVWFVKWPAPIGAASNLSLKWS